ncbi:MAG: ParA family protein [Proteobacteria bacterium]|nr:ParA family protein [Pseudomonadota bacterium]
MANVMVPFTNGKGGVGKTALACSYAAARAHEGADVILADTNEGQQTAMAWSAVRAHNDILPKVRVQPANTREALEMVGRCDVLVVDTPGWNDKGTLLLARKSTFMVIPTGPSPTFDLAPTVKLLHGLRAEGIETWRMGVVLSRFSNDDKIRDSEEELARTYLREAGQGQGGYTVLEGSVRNAPAYGAGLAEGYGLTEIDRGRGLADEARGMMNTISKGVSAALQKLMRLEKELGAFRSNPGKGKERDGGRGR